MGFTEFILRFVPRLMFLRFRKGSLDGWHEPLVEAGLKDVILCPAGKDFNGPVFTHGTGHENKGDIRA